MEHGQVRVGGRAQVQHKEVVREVAGLSGVRRGRRLVTSSASLSLPLTTNPIHTIMGDSGQGGHAGEAADVHGQGHGHENGARAVDDQRD